MAQIDPHRALNQLNKWFSSDHGLPTVIGRVCLRPSSTRFPVRVRTPSHLTQCPALELFFLSPRSTDLDTIRMYLERGLSNLPMQLAFRYNPYHLALEVKHSRRPPLSRQWRA